MFSEKSTSKINIKYILIYVNKIFIFQLKITVQLVLWCQNLIDNGTIPH